MISVDGVFKSFGKKDVLKGISFSSEKNEIIALLGVNGAGKTTTIRMLLGQESPDQGSVRLFGRNPIYPSSRQRIGLTAQNVEFPATLTVFETIDFVRKHYENPYTTSHVVELFNLQKCLKTKASQLSGGEKRRLALALALVGNPSLVFLDEPTTGLDVASRKSLWKVMQQEVEKGKTIFLTTHYLEEIEQIADRVILLQQGLIAFDGTVEEFKQSSKSSFAWVSFDLTENFDLSQLSCVESYEQQGLFVSVQSKDTDQLVRELVQKQVPFQNLNIKKENLETAFLRLSHKEEETP